MENHGNFRLRTRERKAQARVADKEGSKRKSVEQRDKRRRIQTNRRRLIIADRWKVTAWEQLDRTRDIAAEPFEQGEIIAARDAERPRHCVALSFLREKSCKKRPALLATESFLLFGQRCC